MIKYNESQQLSRPCSKLSVMPLDHNENNSK